MTKDEALKLALEALKFNQANWRGKDNAITSIKWALAQPAQEPIKQVLDAEFNRGYKEGVRDAYAKSPQRPWVDLTDEEIGELIIGTLSADTNPAQTRPRDIKFARSVLATFKEKNT